MPSNLCFLIFSSTASCFFLLWWRILHELQSFQGCSGMIFASGVSLPCDGSPTAIVFLGCSYSLTVSHPQPKSLWNVSVPAWLTHSHSVSMVSLPQSGLPMCWHFSGRNFLWHVVYPSISVSPAVSPATSSTYPPLSFPQIHLFTFLFTVLLWCVLLCLLPLATISYN